MAGVCFVCDRRCESLVVTKEGERFLCERDLDLVRFMEECVKNSGTRKTSIGCEGMLMTRVIADILNHPHCQQKLATQNWWKLAPLLNISYSRHRGEDRMLRSLWNSLYGGGEDPVST